MASGTRQVTAEQLWSLPDDGCRHELVEGRLVLTPPPGEERGRIASTISWLLSSHVRSSGSGFTYVEAGFYLARDPDTVRAPDVAFVSGDRMGPVGHTQRYWNGAPDLAVEVVSPNDNDQEVEEKAMIWIEGGSTAVLVVDSRSRSASVYRRGGDVHTLHETDTVDLDDAVPGWRVTVEDFFR